jgi:Ca2+-transporting ATPase
MDPAGLHHRHRRRHEIPFDSHRRRMTVLVDWPLQEEGPCPQPPLPLDEGLVITKGAPLELLQACVTLVTPAGRAPLDGARRQEVLEANDLMAGRGFRVIAVALKCGPAVAGDSVEGSGTEADMEAGQAFLGLIGLYDPPRPEVAAALRVCRDAGIKVTMVTGDYGLTAQAIARQIGLLDPPPGDGVHPAAGADPVRVIEGSTLPQISDVQLRQLLKYRTRLVFARMAPEQKLRLVQAYRALGEVVAVTGDGVNDAPALRAADVGLAMGSSGTDVAREAADIVLLDDNFATIVQAVRYGRAVVANIGRFITYILASNIPEILPFLAMVTLRIPAALSVLQILAVDLGTDLLPALGLGAEPPEPAVMQRPPRRRGQPLLTPALLGRAYLVLGMVEGLAAMVGYLLTWRVRGFDLAALQAVAPSLLHHTAGPALEEIQHQASSVAFAVIVAGQMGNLLACRSARRPFWKLLRVPNPLLWLGFVSEPLVAAGLMLIPPLAAVFAMAPVPREALGGIALTPLAVLAADTLHKASLKKA